MTPHPDFSAGTSAAFESRLPWFASPEENGERETSKPWTGGLEWQAGSEPRSFSRENPCPGRASAHRLLGGLDTRL